MPKIHVNGAEYYYEIKGAGQPLILISGYTGDHFGLLQLAGLLSKHFKVLIFDNRGAGQTTDSGEVLSAELMADDVVALAKKLKLEKPHIIGFSMGGMIAQSFASRYPHLIGRLILCVTTPKLRRAVILAFKSLLAMREKGASFDDIFDASIPWVYGEKFLMDQKGIASLKQMRLKNPYLQSLEGQKRQFQMLDAFDGTHDLEKIKAKTLVVYGTEDIIVLPSEAKFMNTKIPHAELAELPYGHGMVWEAPHVLSDLFIKFLVTKEEYANQSIS